MLGFLAFYRQPHRREMLAEMFWPEAEPLKGRNSLRVALSGLREQLQNKAQPGAGALVIQRETLALAPGATTDVELFRARLQAAHLEGDEELRLEKLKSAVALVRGPLMRGFYDDWILGEAARLEDEFVGALRQIMSAYERRGQLLQALDVARSGAIAAPLREGVLRDVVRLGLACGQSEIVKGEFEAFRRRVERLEGKRPLEWSDFVQRTTQTSVSRPSIPEAAPPSANPTVASSTVVPLAPVDTSWHPTADSIRPLPTVTSSFVGRNQDKEVLTELLTAPATRLITVVGPGGAGKTRLALETVRVLSTLQASNAPAAKTNLHFGVVVWLSLANLPSSRLLSGALLDALGAPAFQEDVETIARILRGLGATSPQANPSPSHTVMPRLLLVVDNCEHLDHGVATFIQDLLARVPILTVLATSRAPLALAGEHPYPLASLDAPPALLGRNRKPGTEVTDAPLWAHPSDAMQLFVERAGQAQNGFSLDAENALRVSEICKRLDGLPLAIEIAAARMAQFSLEHIAAGLKITVSPSAQRNGREDWESAEALTTLSAGGVPDAQTLIRSLGLGSLDWSHPDAQSPRRQSSLRLAIEWSTDQLPPSLARFWARLSVFGASFSSESAAEVCEEPNAATYIQTLREASLLSALPSVDETIRSVWLEALCEFASEMLSPGEKARLEARHAAYFLNWAAQISPLLDIPSGTREQRALEAEAVNLRSALDWLLEHDLEGALRLVNALSWGWEQTGHLVEGRRALETALERSRVAFAVFETCIGETSEHPPGVAELKARERLRERARALEGAGKLANLVADHAAVEIHLAESLRLFRLLNDEIGTATCLYAMGFNALRQGDQETARRLCQESLEMVRHHPDPIVLSDSLYNLSMVALMSGDYATVRSLCAERLTLGRASDDGRSIGISLEILGLAALFEGEFAAASTYFSQCLTAFEALEEKPSIARALWGLGQVALQSARFKEARAYFLRASGPLRATHNLWAMPYLLESFGALAVAETQWERAALLLGGAAGLRGRQREPLAAPYHQQEFERLCENTRQALGEAAFERLWQRGYDLERTQLLDLAESPRSEPMQGL